MCILKLTATYSTKADRGYVQNIFFWLIHLVNIALQILFWIGKAHGSFHLLKASVSDNNIFNKCEFLFSFQCYPERKNIRKTGIQYHSFIHFLNTLRRCQHTPRSTLSPETQAVSETMRLSRQCTLHLAEELHMQTPHREVTQPILTFIYIYIYGIFPITLFQLGSRAIFKNRHEKPRLYTRRHLRVTPAE